MQNASRNAIGRRGFIGGYYREPEKSGPIPILHHGRKFSYWCGPKGNEGPSPPSTALKINLELFSGLTKVFMNRLSARPRPSQCSSLDSGVPSL
ncbi:uncharacterized protein G2W53_027463 [Senna tora]|uniref:Uncharacterized protein n=1 Tax=Senna tora TaxID=362788 RepID=A0A834TH64_9FABA|nr:uncharacterized protein G2W53_027463 [Senna tora]